MTRRNILMALIMMIPMMNCFNERKGTTELEEMEEIEDVTLSCDSGTVFLCQSLHWFVDPVIL